MTSYSPRIYLYKITFEEVPYYYYGVHKEKVFGEEYWGSPVTNKWCWELYTPKRQILEIFEFSDGGWIEAQEVETRLIKPFYNTDKWCLNEHCGGKMSLDVLRENGRGAGQKSYELGIAVHSRTKEQMTKDGMKGGNKVKELGLGIHSLTSLQKSEAGKKGSNKCKELGIGIFALTMEQKIENGKKGAKILNSQKWMCLETGYVTTSGPLTRYQKGKGIDTSKRKKVA